MSVRIAILAGVALALFPLSAHAAPAPAPAMAARANALALSNLLNPTDKLVGLTVRGFDEGFRAALKQQGESAAFFEQNPKLVESIIAAARPVVQRHALSMAPALQSEFADFYARRFTAQEIEGLIAFYRSPTGTKMIEGMYAGADFDAMIEAIGPEGDRTVTSKDVSGIVGSTVQRILPAFNRADRQALDKFSATPLFAKMSRVLPEFHQLMADIANRPTPEMDADVEKAVQGAVEDYLAKAEAAHAHS